MGKSKAAPEVPAGRLWPNTPSGAELKIEVFGATGEYMSGKTLLGLSIAPGVHPEGHSFASKPRTLLLDFEKSAGTYGGAGCQRVDVPSKLMELSGKSTYTPLDTFTWFLDLVTNKIKPGQFDVIMADPVTDIESGMVDFVKKNHDKFGLTAAQVARGGGLVWGAVKDYWKQILLKLGSQCQTFFFTSHLRQVWNGNTPTNKREPKGKETLMELASLYLWLERKADKDGKVPPVPSGIVLKGRLADTRVDLETGLLKVIQLLPPRLPQATVQAIRGYIANPPDYAHLKTGERVIEEAMSEEDKLALRLATAEAEKATEESRLAQLSRRAELQAMQQRAAEQRPQSSDQSAAQKQVSEQKREAAAKAAASEPDDAERLVEEVIAAEAETRRETETERLLAGNEEFQRLHGPSPEETAKRAETSPPDTHLATRTQVMEVQKLAKELALPKETLVTILARANVKKVSELTREHCHSLIEKLRAKCDAKAAAAGGPAQGN